MQLLNNFQRYGGKEREISNNFDFSQFAIFGFLFTDRTSRFEVKRDGMGVEDGYCTARFVSSISSMLSLFVGGRKSLVSVEGGGGTSDDVSKEISKGWFQRVKSWALRVRSFGVTFFFPFVKC